MWITYDDHIGRCYYEELILTRTLRSTHDFKLYSRGWLNVKNISVQLYKLTLLFSLSLHFTHSFYLYFEHYALPFPTSFDYEGPSGKCCS